jgi:hypothetical protein
VDDGVQGTHPDLRANYSAADSFDFPADSATQFPRNTSDNHGTPVAGVAAARGGNGIGVTGAAPFARIAGLRATSDDATESSSTDATLYRSNSATGTIKIKNHSYGPSQIFADTSAQYAAITTTTNFGTIHVWAAGNERVDDNFVATASQDAGKDMNNNHPDVVCVAALNSDGTFSYYSDFGTCIFVTSPSNGENNQYGILTTDRTGNNGDNPGKEGNDPFPNRDYTSQFGGTSSAAPLVAGVLALAKQAQPKLNARFVKHLLALTSRMVDPQDRSPSSDGGWKRNAANFPFNQNYGFGMIDAGNLTAQAVEFTGVTPLETLTTGNIVVGGRITDNSTVGLSRTFRFTSSTPLENVLVTLNISHPRRGDLTAYLTSPSGRKTRLFMPTTLDTESDIQFSFCANAFWGENPTGLWRLTVLDTRRNSVGTLNSFSVQARLGRLIAVPIASVLTPNNVNSGAASLALNVAGRRFTPASYVTIDGVRVPTQFLSVGLLRATIPGSELTQKGAAKIRVVTPNPGGSSAELDLNVN